MAEELGKVPLLNAKSGLKHHDDGGCRDQFDDHFHAHGLALQADRERNGVDLN